MTLTVTAWNVRQGGGERAQRITDALVSLGTDVAVISEWRASSRNRLSERLAAAGFEHQDGIPCPAGGYAALLVASKRPLTRTNSHYDDADDNHRFCEVSVTGRTGGEWNIAGAYIPGFEKDSTRKERFWSYLVDQWAPVAAGRNTLLCGDLNTGLHYRDELGATLQCAQHQASLERSGWRDAWIEKNRQKRPPGSWFSPRFGNPFRLDHAILSPNAPAAKRVGYPETINGESVRGPGGLSDHLPVVVELWEK